ncbi:hypothetical protein ABTZ99_39655 [Actinosynnema sp. NPDC002837]
MDRRLVALCRVGRRLERFPVGRRPVAHCLVGRCPVAGLLVVRLLVVRSRVVRLLVGHWPAGLLPAV